MKTDKEDVLMKNLLDFAREAKAKVKKEEEKAMAEASMTLLTPGKMYKIHTVREASVALKKLPVFRSVDQGIWLYKNDVVMFVESDDMFAKFLRADKTIVCLASVLWQGHIEFQELE